MSESYVQVAPDSTGKKIRNLQISEPQAVDAAGNAQADLVRNQQVISIANRRGDLPDTFEEQMLAELRLIRERLDQISLQLE